MSEETTDGIDKQNVDIPHHQQIEKFGGGHIESRHGRVNGWLCVVYLVLFVWAIYYGFTYWGGLGPGLDY
jgi:hypothetical protein